MKRRQFFKQAAGAAAAVAATPLVPEAKPLTTVPDETEILYLHPEDSPFEALVNMDTHVDHSWVEDELDALPHDNYLTPFGQMVTIRRRL